MNNDLLYQIALTLINGVGAVQAKQLIEQFGTAESIFKAKKKDWLLGRMRDSCYRPSSLDKKTLRASGLFFPQRSSSQSEP